MLKFYLNINRGVYYEKNDFVKYVDYDFIYCWLC